MQEKRIQRVRMTVAHCSLGSAVRQLRAARYISQETLGARAGLHRNYVGAIERGEINPTFLTLLRLTSGIEIPLSGLIILCEQHHAERIAGPRIGRAHDDDPPQQDKRVASKDKDRPRDGCSGTAQRH